MPRVADLAIRRVRPLEPREFTEFRAVNLPKEWRDDTHPHETILGEPWTIEQAMFEAQRRMSIVPPLQRREVCKCRLCTGSWE